LGSDESQEQDRHEYETEEEDDNEEKDNEKTDIIDGETKRRIIFSANTGRARVLNWRSGQRGETIIKQCNVISRSCNVTIALEQSCVFRSAQIRTRTNTDCISVSLQMHSSKEKKTPKKR